MLASLELTPTHRRELNGIICNCLQRSSWEGNLVRALQCVVETRYDIFFSREQGKWEGASVRNKIQEEAWGEDITQMG